MDKFIQLTSFVIIFISTFVIVGFIYYFIHELGHALAMLIVGFKISSFTAVPFVIYLDENKYRFKIDFSKIKRYFGKVQPIIHDVHTVGQYNRLKPKICFVLAGGNILEILTIIGLVMFSNTLLTGDFKMSVIMSTWTWVVISCVFGIDLIGIYKICTDQISKEICIYDWVAYGNYIDDKTLELAVAQLLKKYMYVKRNTINIKKDILISYYNVILDLYLSGEIVKMPEQRIEMLEDFYQKPQLIFKKSLYFRNMYLESLYKYLVYLSLIKNEKDTIKKVYGYLNKNSSSIEQDGVSYQKRRVEFILGIVDEGDFIKRSNITSQYFSDHQGYIEINAKIDKNLYAYYKTIMIERQ